METKKVRTFREYSCFFGESTYEDTLKDYTNFVNNGKICVEFVSHAFTPSGELHILVTYTEKE